MAPGSTFGMIAILLAEALIPLGASAQRWCQGQGAWVSFTDAFTLQPAVVPVVRVEDIKLLSHPCSQ